jgi:hypothetical protein
MSGRGKGRVGRGRSQGRSNYTGLARRKNQPSKKSITDWNYYFGSAKHALEFKATTEFVLNYIREQLKFGNDIAKAIDDQQPVETKT